MSRQLVPLRVPAGWAVIFNILVELDHDQSTPEDIDSYLSDDILSMEQIRMSDGKWETDPDGILIDVGWSDPGSRTGEYVINVAEGGWDGPTAAFRVRSSAEVAQKIEQIFDDLLAGRSVSTLAEGSTQSDV